MWRNNDKIQCRHTSEDSQPSYSNIKPQDNMLSSMPATTKSLFWFSIHDNTQCFNIRRHERLECHVSRLSETIKTHGNVISIEPHEPLIAAWASTRPTDYREPLLDIVRMLETLTRDDRDSPKTSTQDTDRHKELTDNKLTMKVTSRISDMTLLLVHSTCYHRFHQTFPHLKDKMVPWSPIASFSVYEANWSTVSQTFLPLPTCRFKISRSSLTSSTNTLFK